MQHLVESVAGRGVFVVVILLIHLRLALLALLR